MTKNTLSSILIGLLSVLAVACGDAGNAAFDEELSPGDVLAGNEEEVELDPDLGVNEGEADPGAEEVAEPENEEDPPIVVGEPACGDGLVDPIERCDDGNIEDGDGCSSACELEVQGQISIDVTLDDLTSNEEPLSDTCADRIDLLIGVDAIAGSGTCSFEDYNNFLRYSVDLDLGLDGAVEGEIEIILNGVSHVVDVKGTFEDDAFFFEFAGVTPINQSIRAIWQGKQKAELD
jgi:cysteine-rich repeat protein